MEQLKPILAQYGAKGLSIMRKSKFAIQTLLQKHRTSVIIVAAIGAGAYAFVSKESPKIQLPQEERDKVFRINHCIIYHFKCFL